MTSRPARITPTIAPSRLALYALINLAAVILPAIAFRRFQAPVSASICISAATAFTLFITTRRLRRHASKAGTHNPDRFSNAILILSALIGLLLSFHIVHPRFVALILSNPAGTLLPLTMFLAIGGIQLLILALRHRRVGDTLHCPKCDYELGAPPDEAPIRCPECATPWLNRWKKGASRRSPALALIAAILLLAGSLPWLLKLTALGAASLTLLPTSTLISVTALDPWGHNKDAWTELTSRKLSPQHTALLAEKLLDLRLAHGYLYGQPASWLGAAATSQSLPQPLTDRYYAEWFEPDIRVPLTITQGANIPIAITAIDRKGSPASWMHIWIDSIALDAIPISDPAFEASRQKWVFSLYFTDSAFPTGYLSSRDLITYPTLDTTQPGQHTLTLTAYRCVVPMATPLPQLPPTQSTPHRPPAATHFEKFTIEKTITITPP